MMDAVDFFIVTICACAIYVIMDLLKAQRRSNRSDSPPEIRRKSRTFSDQNRDDFVPITPYDVPNYKMDNKSRGRALLINMEKFDDALQLETRLGSSADLDRLEKICKEKLMFEAPVVLRSPTKAEIFAEIEKIELENHVDNDCLLVVMMTHGGENGILAAYDTHFRAFELWEGFMGKECKSLTGKPKLFILQACRGDPKHVDTGVRYRVVADARGSSEKVLSVPSSADQLIMYATSEGNYSMRCESSGSWLIQILCNQLEKNNKDDFLSILTKVNRKVALRIVGNDQTEARADARRLNLTGAKQCPVVVHTLTKKLFFSNSA